MACSHISSRHFLKNINSMRKSSTEDSAMALKESLMSIMDMSPPASPRDDNTEVLADTPLEQGRADLDEEGDAFGQEFNYEQ